MNLKSKSEQLKTMLECFAQGGDRSKAFAGQIEGFLVENFYDDDRFQELLIGLASYAPEGGDLLYDETALLSLVRGVLRDL